MLNIVELLSLRGLNTNCKIKLVRHRDKRYDVDLLLRKGQLELYQSYQSKLIFECDYVVSFIGLDDSKACFLGVYKVLGRKPAREVPLPKEFIYPDFEEEYSEDYFYILEEVPGFDDFKMRVIIDWGNLALAWHQWLTEKEVIEILPPAAIN